jgi:hypothetical protein
LADAVPPRAAAPPPPHRRRARPPPAPPPPAAQKAAQAVKESLDKKLGAAWHVVVGEGYSWRCTHARGAYLFALYEKVGVLVFKS